MLMDVLNDCLFVYLLQLIVGLLQENDYSTVTEATFQATVTNEPPSGKTNNVVSEWV